MSAQTLGLSEESIDFPIIPRNVVELTEPVQYLPFGTKTLKLRAYVPENGGEFRLRPVPLNTDSRPDWIAGHEDDAKDENADLLVTWGEGIVKVPTRGMLAKPCPEVNTVTFISM